MRFIIFATHLSALPFISHLHGQGNLSAVISTDRMHARNRPVEDLCKINHIPFYKINKNELATIVEHLFHDIKPDAVFMFGFSYRIPSYLIEQAGKGFFNVHFSMLPKYKGPDPLFWQIRNGETLGGITIHRVSNEFDSGEIVMQQQMHFIPGENWGICNGRFSYIANTMLSRLAEQIVQGSDMGAVTSDDLAESGYSRPSVKDLSIHWQTQTARDIENLVNAANPLYGGAITSYQNRPLRILEVSPVDEAEFPGAVAGEVVHHDHTGLYVLCADRNLLRINVVMFDDIILSGFKLGLTAVRKGGMLGEATFNYQMDN